VHDPSDTTAANEERDVWLIDITMFNDLFATGARRVDMNTDGTTDAILYQDANDAATWP
jgi:hypothetical protein